MKWNEIKYSVPLKPSMDRVHGLRQFTKTTHLKYLYHKTRYWISHYTIVMATRHNHIWFLGHTTHNTNSNTYNLILVGNCKSLEKTSYTNCCFSVPKKSKISGDKHITEMSQKQTRLLEHNLPSTNSPAVTIACHIHIRDIPQGHDTIACSAFLIGRNNSHSDPCSKQKQVSKNKIVWGSPQTPT